MAYRVFYKGRTPKDKPSGLSGDYIYPNYTELTSAEAKRSELIADAGEHLYECRVDEVIEG